MPVFLIVMAIGLSGLVLMALPGLFRHGHSPPHHTGHSAHAPAPTAGHLAHPSGGKLGLGWRWLPEPRFLLTFMALLGAFGNVIEHAAHWPFWISAVAASIPAWALERLAVRPLWSLALKFQGLPSRKTRFMWQSASPWACCC